MKLLGFLFKIILYVFVGLLVLAFFAAIVYVPTAILEPRWTLQKALILLATVIGVIGLFMLIPYLWRRRREKKFVNRLIEQDDAAHGERSDRDRERMRFMQRQWKESVNKLHRSRARRHDSSLYALPWYLLLGETGSGKSTAAQRSGLMSPLGEALSTARLGSTQDCDWWFSEDAILLDTGGCYLTNPSDEDPQWSAFMSLLVQYRKKEPISGIIVTIGADRLMRDHADDVCEYGERVGRRLDSLMRRLGHRFPVYIVVTKLDLLMGVTEAGRLLPENALAQCLGLINDDPDGSAEAFVADTFDYVGDQLRDLRLILLHNNHEVDPSVLLFPDEIERLKPGLQAFARGAFAKVPYQVPPLFRGVHLTSGIRDGEPMLDTLRNLGLPDLPPPAIDTHGGSMFLRDFFKDVLPRDRSLRRPIPEFLRLRSATRNLLLLTWLVVMVAGLVLIGAGYLQNKQTIEVFKEKAVPPSKLEPIDRQQARFDRKAFAANLERLSALRTSVQSLEAMNAELWWCPFFRQSRELERILKQQYTTGFRQAILVPFDKEFSLFVNKNLPLSGQDINMGISIEHMIRRINLVRALVKNESTENTPPPSYSALLMLNAGLAAGQTMQNEVANQFPDLYQTYVRWEPEKRRLAREGQALNSDLFELTTRQNQRMLWLIAWSNQLTGDNVNDITLVNYWDLPERSRNITTPMIHRSFTLAGRAKIYSLLDEYRSALMRGGQPPVRQEQALRDFAQDRETFTYRYTSRVFEAWLNFARRFNTGKELLLADIGSLSRTADRLALLDGPYNHFLKRAESELGQFADLLAQKEVNTRPQWIELLHTLRGIRLSSRDISFKSKKTFGSFFYDWYGKARPMVGKIAREGHESNLRIWEAYRFYKDSLAKLAPAKHVNASDYFTEFENAYKALSTLNVGDGKESSLAIAKLSYDKLRYESVRGGTRGEEAIWTLVRGPLDFMAFYASQQTSRTLQERWKTEVLGKVQDVPRFRRPQVLFNSVDGVIWNFDKNNTRSFIMKDELGYRARIIFKNLPSPINKDYLAFLDKGAKGAWGIQESYTVDIKGLPTSSNREAIEHPYSVTLIHYLNDGINRLKNLNYPNSRTFHWTPGKGGKVEIQIKLATITLVKQYRGEYGFANFIHDFRDGFHVFTPKDFGDFEKMLTGLRIKRIKVRFEFRGAEPVLRLHNIINLKVPARIARPFGSDAVQAAPAKASSATATAARW